MYEIKNILTPLNLGDPNHEIVPYIESMARSHRARVHLLYIFMSVAMAANPIYLHDFDMDAINGRIFKEAEKHLYRIAEDHFSGLPDVQTQVIMGTPSRRILDYANNNEIDLIVMGSHGRKGVNRAIFGSVAEKVLKNSKIPVLVVNTFKEAA